jgi:hypothetical protein
MKILFATQKKKKKRIVRTFSELEQARLHGKNCKSSPEAVLGPVMTIVVWHIRKFNQYFGGQRAQFKVWPRLGPKFWGTARCMSSAGVVRKGLLR